MGCNGSKQAATGAKGPLISSSQAVVETQPMPSHLKHQVFSQHYQLLTGEDSKLGEGQFAVVRKGINRSTGAIVAVKCIELSRLTKEDEDALEVEVEVMRRLKHPNLVQFVDYFEDVDYNYLVMEMMTGGELFTRIVEKEKYSEAEAQRLVRTLVEAIKFCHDLGIVHRDLKPENILLANPADDAPLKIADFGFAKFDLGNARNLSTACGTPGYVAPEILKGDKYGKEVDVWSLGVIAYILLCGYPPFHSSNQARLFELIKAGEFEFDEADWKDISVDAKDLIARMLTVDPLKRMTTTQTLSHAWLVNTASDAPLPGTIGALKMFNARRKLKAGMNAVRSAVRVRMLLNALKNPALVAAAAAAASAAMAAEASAAELTATDLSDVLFDKPTDALPVLTPPAPQPLPHAAGAPIMNPLLVATTQSAPPTQ